MNEIQELQERIAQMELKTAQMELKSKKQSVRQRFLIVLAVVCVGFSAAAQKGYTQSSNQQVLVARRLQIVDTDNKVVADIGVNTDGEGYVSLWNGSYRKTVVLGATTDEGSGLITVNDYNGKTMHQLFSTGSVAKQFKQQ